MYVRLCVVLQVKVEKIKKRLILYIDNKMVKRVKGIRKVNVGRELFLGGLPSGVAGSIVNGWQVRIIVIVIVSYIHTKKYIISS